MQNAKTWDELDEAERDNQRDCYNKAEKYLDRASEALELFRQVVMDGVSSAGNERLYQRIRDIQAALEAAQGDYYNIRADI